LAPVPPSPSGRSLRLALLGLVLGFAGVVGYFVLVLKFGAWVPGARNNALPSWLLIAGGLTLSLVAVGRARRRLAAIALLLANVSVAGLFASLIYVSFAVPAANGPAIGSPAADFALADQTGRTAHLADFAGKPLLLVFYRGHW
jgi:hypothetical protein